MKKTALIALIALIALPVVAIVLTVGVAIWLTTDDALATAADKCEVDGAPEIVRLGDEGDSLTVAASGQASQTSMASACVLNELDAPDSMIAKIVETSAAQGRQEDAWDSWKASWTFHPDDGLQLIVEKD